MEANKKSINDILNGNRQLVIPFFQRSYVWEEDLWERFLESMKHVSTFKKEYFLGAIILKQQMTAADSHIGDVRLVIDGQQRITTLILFLKVLCTRLDRIKKFERLILLDENQYSLRHNMFDKPIFEEIIRQQEIEKMNYDTKLAHAYNFFIDNVKAEDYNLDTILQHISFVGIDLSIEDDEQVIFDTINSLGVTLTTGELLKNYLFTQDTIEKYLSTWKPTFELDDETLKYWDNPTTQGRLVRKNLESFLYAYLHIKISDPQFNLSSSQKLRFRTAEDLFSQYKYFLEISSFPKDAFIDDLTNYAKCYRQYISPLALKEEIPSEWGYERLNVIAFGLDSTTIIPYVLYLLKNQNDPQEFAAIAHILEAYLMRRIVCKSTNDNYSDLFSQSLISNHILTAEKLIDYINLKEADSSLAMPKNEELLNGFNKSLLQNNRAKGVIYLIESKLRTSHHSTTLRPFDSYSLEHLMPKKWSTENWPIDDNVTTEERNFHLKTLGNLAIITQGLNSSVSNNSWLNKKAGTSPKRKGLTYYANDLETIKIPLSLASWTEQDIHDRAQWLYEKSLLFWSFDADANTGNGGNSPVQDTHSLSVSSAADNANDLTNDNIVRPLGHDASRFSLNGSYFMAKSHFAFEVVKTYLSRNPNTTYYQLRKVFPNSLLRGGPILKGLLATADDLLSWNVPEEKLQKCYKFNDSNRILKSSDNVEFFVSTQWSITTILRMVEKAQELGMTVQRQDNGNLPGPSIF